MKLLTKEILKALPPLYANEEKTAEETMAVVKFFNPMGRATWYATEFDPAEGRFFGYVDLIGPDCAELGYFMLSELEEIRLPFGLKIERDTGWTPKPLSEVIATVQRGQIAV